MAHDGHDPDPTDARALRGLCAVTWSVEDLWDNLRCKLHWSVAHALETKEVLDR